MIQKQSQYPSAKTVKLLFSQIQQCYFNQNANKLYSALKQLYNDPAYNSNAQRWNVNINFNSYYSGKSAINAAFGKILQTIKQYQSQKLNKGIHYAFRLHLDILGQILKLLDLITIDQVQEYLWLCKPLRQIIHNTKKIFISASKKDQQSTGVAKVKKDQLIIKLQQYKTRRTLIDEVKKQIIPLIDNLQVSIMLVYHSYDQISRILDNTKSYGEHGPQFINNYYFQKGKTALIYQRFKDAQEYFQKIKIRTRGQKRLILKYLIPCKMFLGKVFQSNPNNPQQHFPQYKPIIQSLCHAKFNDYNEAITKYQKIWIKRGIYLLMDKLRIILWRNLLKKVHKILESDKLQIDKIHKAVKMSGGDQKIQECLCIISNLIYQGYIKGYIFQTQEHKVLVLKKGGEGFPSLSKL